MHTVHFKEDNGFKSFEIIPDDKKVYSDFAVVENTTGDLFAVVVDYEEFDSYSSEKRVDFVDAFSKIEGTEALALMIKNAMDNTSERDFGSYKERESFGVDYENDLGRMVRCSLSKWFSWGSRFRGIAIVRASNIRLKGIEYR